MNAVLPASGKLVNAGDVWVRAEVRMIGDPADAWRPNRAGSGTVTPKGSVERVLMLERDADGQTTVLHRPGIDYAAATQALRPDLTIAEYPQ